MFKIVAVNTLDTMSIPPVITENSLVSFITANYIAVLTEARCPCSGDPKPCPTGQKFWGESIQNQNKLVLDKLYKGILSLQTALINNKDKVENKAKIKEFLIELDRQFEQIFTDPSSHRNISDIKIKLTACIQLTSS